MRTKKRILAFALASAMVLSTVPASSITVKAASTPVLNLSKKYLTVGETSKMWIRNKVSNATYRFSSSNTKIASINQTTGVIKGVAVGNCKVTLKATVGKKTYTSTATIIVKEHADTIRFSTDETEVTLPVGNKVHVFSALMTTKSGGKCTDWPYFIIPEDTNTAGATVDGKGNVSIKQPGSFQIIAVASDSWNTMFNKKIYRAQSEPLTVKVPVTMETSMQSVNKIKVDTNVSLSSYTKDDFTVTSESTGQVLKISDMEISSDNTDAVLTTANTFGKGDTYQVSLTPQSLSDSFVANYGTISKIVANEEQAIAPNVATPLVYTIYDENGIDITKLYPHTMAGFDFEFEPSSITLDEYGRINLPTKSSYAFYTITYTYLDSANQKQVISSNRGRVTASGSNLKSLQGYTISTNGNPDYSNAVHSVAANETGRKLYFLFDDSTGGTIDTAKTTVNNLTFTSNNTSVCGIDRTTGLLFPYKEGTAEITVTDGIFTTRVTITVGATRKLNSLVADQSSVTVSSTSGLSNSDSIHFELRDQYGEVFKPSTSGTSSYPTVRLISGNDNVIAVNGNTVTKTARNIYTSAYSGSFDLTFSGKNNGTCTVEISYAGKTCLIDVTVKQPGVVSTYKPELSNTVLDPNVQGKNTAILKVYAVDANGIKISTVTDGYYTITYSDGTIVVPSQLISSASGETIDATKLKLKDGTYRLTITSGPITESTTFEVKASDALINIVSKNTPSTTVQTNDDVVTKIMDCFNIYLSGNSTAIPASSLITGSSPLLSNVRVSFTSYDSRYFDSTTDLAIGGKDFTKNYIGYTASIRVTKISFTYMGQTFIFEPNQDITLRVQS